MTTPDLLPCPFCGGDKVWIRQIDMGKFHYAECQGCLAITTYHDTKAEAIAAWNTRAGRWIPVSERLPEPFVDVNGYSKLGVSVGYFTASGLWYEEGADMSWRNITHWMPLPLPPKEVEG